MDFQLVENCIFFFFNYFKRALVWLDKMERVLVYTLICCILSNLVACFRTSTHKNLQKWPLIYFNFSLCWPQILPRMLINGDYNFTIGKWLQDISRCLLWTQRHHQTWPPVRTDALTKPVDLLMLNRLRESYCSIRVSPHSISIQARLLH